jgi:Reverse transcriptase (RNA-dependent DNA polymerase)
MIAVHTNDMAVTASTILERDSILCDLQSMFDITDLGDIRWMFGIEIFQDRDNRTISMSQTAYIDRILK